MTAHSNFGFLETEYPILFNIGKSAEYNLHKDPVTTLFKTRLFCEKLVDFLFEENWLAFPDNNNLSSRIHLLDVKDILPSNAKDLLNTVRKKGNIAIHEHEGNLSEAKYALYSCFVLSKWFFEVYAESEDDLSTLRFKMPENIDTQLLIQSLEKDYKELENKFNELLADRKTGELSTEKQNQILKKSKKAARKIDMSEAETRVLIDDQLRQAGWEVDTEKLNFKNNKTLPEKGRNIAIAEWKVDGGWADYALFVGMDMFGIVEAKKYANDVSSDLTQAKRYATNLKGMEDFPIFLGEWRGYKVPFLFSTNGRPYLKQIETKSGIWFYDVRKRNNHARCLKGWFSPEGLQELWERDFEEANEKLKATGFEFLTNKNGLGLRYYQINAIKAIEAVLMREETAQRKRVLLAMATGTGKTRTIIGLCYRLIKTNRFRRILFLVDRRLLAMQAYDNFKDNRVEDLNTFAEIYDVKGLKDLTSDLETTTRLHFSTVQGMVKRLFYSENDIPAIDTYDCIVIDEAHRGYLLDKEMDEDELQFKDQQDYVSKYRMVIDYFDAFAIGLTATPALHTKTIFGSPVFTYSYREAVIDGFLIDHEPPHLIKTKLSEEGIVWEKGEKPKVYNKEDSTIEELDELEDELRFEIQHFNKMVITESFNRTVIQQLVNEIDPEGGEKTLVFAATDAHADLVVKIFKEEFAAIGVEIPDEAVMKITGKTDKPSEWLLRYKNEQFPNIAVTVDLLTTGIDVPPISNLVFVRRINSRILYEQMLGRATRLCPEINKEIFRIFDAVRLYEGLKDYTQMKPVSPNPKTSFEQLVEELDYMQTEGQTKKQVEQIIAKFQRKKKYINESNQEKFEYLTDSKTPNEWVEQLKNLSPSDVQTKLPTYKGLWRFLDELKPAPTLQLVSEHEDEYIATERGYGKGEKPEDYLESFKEFILRNRNKIAALEIVCTKPTSLDRKSLKELKLMLDAEGFNTMTLNTAWKSAKNEDIAADIISYIRTLTIGSSLIDHEKRIKNAMDKVRKMKSWNRIQLNWLEKFEKQLLQESILQAEDLDNAPFKRDGGYTRLNKIFQLELDMVLETINEELYNVA